MTEKIEKTEKGNLWDIVESGELEVVHKHQRTKYKLPDWLASAKGCLEDEDKLAEWARDNKALHGTLIAGIKHMIIDIRALGRPRRKTDGDDMLANKPELQERIYGYRPPSVKRPGESDKTSKDIKKTMDLMRGVGLTEEEIAEVMESARRIALEKKNKFA